MSGFLPILQSVFSSKEKSLVRQIELQNDRQGFPVKSIIDINQIARVGNALLLSGNDDTERAFAIVQLLRRKSGKAILLHNGNSYFNKNILSENGITSSEWNGIEYGSMTKSQLLAVLVSEDVANMDMAYFYSFAIDVVKALKMPITLQSLLSINWSDIEWQHHLIERAEQEDVVDLLSRYDRDMAKRASQAIVKLERFRRVMDLYEGNGNEASLDSLLERVDVVIKDFAGSESLLKQILDFLHDYSERGNQFTLILDGMFVKHPLIQNNNIRVPVILSVTDLAKCAAMDMSMPLTHRVCDVVLFYHAQPSSQKILSQNYFGEFDKRVADVSIGRGKRSTDWFGYNQNQTISFHYNRELRLKPELFESLNRGMAFVRLADGREGILCL